MKQKNDAREWMKRNKGKLFGEKDAENIENILSKGTSFHCSNYECSHTWKAKSGEVYLTCPKCGKSLVSFVAGKTKNSIIRCHTTGWDQEDL